MTNQELQQAIDKTREWLNPQLTTTQTPSLKAKEDAIAYLAELQKIQVTRAAMASAPTLTPLQPSTRLYQMPADSDYMAAMGPCGK